RRIRRHFSHSRFSGGKSFRPRVRWPRRTESLHERRERIYLPFRESFQRFVDREFLRGERRRELVPIQGHRNRREGGRAHGIGRDHVFSLAVLHHIHVSASAAGGDVTLHRRDLGLGDDYFFG